MSKSRQLSAVGNTVLSEKRYQLSAISRQLSAISQGKYAGGSVQ